MATVLLINGPNLNMLGGREPGHYGHASLTGIESTLRQQADEHGGWLECFQSNAEHKLVECIQGAPVRSVDFIIINPAAFTHTSVAIRDALLAVGIPYIEVHLSNVHAREPFRQHSYLSDCAVGVITGFGAAGYEYALDAAFRRLGQD